MEGVFSFVEGGAGAESVRGKLRSLGEPEAQFFQMHCDQLSHATARGQRSSLSFPRCEELIF